MIKVSKIIEWEGTDGMQRSVMLVEDESLPPNDVRRQRLEMAVYDKKQDEWKTENTFDYVEEITSFGIPKGMAD